MTEVSEPEPEIPMPPTDPGPPPQAPPPPEEEGERYDGGAIPSAGNSEE